MTGQIDNNIKKNTSSQQAAKTDAPVQDAIWQRFDAMLQEFLKMEQTSPAANQPRKPVETRR